MNSIVKGQELNLGFHIDPIFSLPIVSGAKSVRNDQISVAVFRPGYNVGLNLNYKLKNNSLELAANYVRKSVSVFNTRGHHFGQKVYYRSTMAATCFEFPLTINFLMERHDSKTRYDLYLLAGIGYELARIDTATSSDYSMNGSVRLDLAGRYAGPVFQNSVVPQIGFKINAILKNVGFIDYGVSFHLPISVSGPFNVDAQISSGSSLVTQNASIYATLAFIDIKLCYYFYSIGKKFKRVKYRIT